MEVKMRNTMSKTIITGLAALALGANGAVGSTYNFAAPLYLQLIKDYREGRADQARAGQLQAARMIALLSRAGGLSAGKAAMEMTGIDCGSPRLPMRALGRDDKHALFRSLEKIGFLEFCCK